MGIGENRLTGYVDFVAKKVYINGVRMEEDSLGGFEIDVEKIVAAQGTVSEIVKLDRGLQEVYTKAQISLLFTFWGASGSFTITDVAALLKVNKETAREVLVFAMRCDVLTKGYNSSWKVVNKMTKTQLLDKAKLLNDEDKPQDNAMTIIQKHKDQWKKDREEKEQVGGEEYVESEESKIDSNDESMQIKVGMKGEGSTAKVKMKDLHAINQKVVSSQPVSLAKVPLLPHKKATSKAQKSPLSTRKK